MNRAIAPQPAEEERGHHRCAEHGDPLAKPKLGPLAEQEGRAEDLDGPVGKLADRGLRFAFDATVEDVGLGIGADCADEEKLRGPSAQPGARQSHNEVVIDQPKRRLRACPLDGGAQATEYVVDVGQVARDLELPQVQHALLELLVLLGRRAAAHRHDAGPASVGEQTLEDVTADQPGRACQQCRATHAL